VYWAWAAAARADGRQAGFEFFPFYDATFSQYPMNCIKTNLPTVVLSKCVLTIMMIAAGCSIKGSFQGLYSYYDKTKEKAPHLIRRLPNSVCGLAQSEEPVIYSVNGVELKKCLEHFEKSLVYIWRPKCSSDICVSPGDTQIFCTEGNIELFVVAEYYDFEMMSLNHSVNHPILGIDCDFYSTHLTNKYIPMFMADILEDETNVKGNYFFLFEYGCLIDKSQDIKKLKM
jgi:hypothetical protein